MGLHREKQNWVDDFGVTFQGVLQNPVITVQFRLFRNAEEKFRVAILGGLD